MRKPTMASRISRRSGTRDGVRVLVSHTYPLYIHHSSPKIRSTRPADAGVTCSPSTLVSCVIVKTKTRSKNSSIVLTRSGGSGSGCPGRDVMPVPAAADLGAFQHVVGRRAGGGQIRPRADRVQHPASRRDEVAAPESSAGVQ